MPQVKYDEIKKNIQNNEFSNLYFWEGEEYFIQYFEKIISDKVLNSKKNDFNFTILNGENINIENLVNTLETFPVGSEKKCVIVKNLDLSAFDNEKIKELLEIISDVPNFCVLIITIYEAIINKKTIDKIKKIKELSKKIGIYANLSQKDIPLERQITVWAKKEFGKEMTTEIAKMIISQCGEENLNFIKNELKKICECESKQLITKESLAVLSKSKLKCKPFDLPKAVMSGDTKKSFEILEALLSQGEEPIVILAILSSEFFDILRCKICLESNKNTSMLTEIFDYKNKEFRLNLAERKCVKFSLNKIKKCLKFLLEADLKLKSTSINPRLILEKLILELILIDKKN